MVFFRPFRAPFHHSYPGTRKKRSPLATGFRKNIIKIMRHWAGGRRSGLKHSWRGALNKEVLCLRGGAGAAGWAPPKETPGPLRFRFPGFGRFCGKRIRDPHDPTRNF